MAELVLVSMVCPDQVGLIAGITGRLFDLGVNLRDVTFAVMGQGAEFSAVCELPARMDVEELHASLATVPELAGVQIKVMRFAFDPTPGPLARITHRVEVSGGDQPGLIARLSDIFTQFGANIVRLDAQTLPDHALPDHEGGRYTIRFAVAIPAERAASCLNTVANTAESLGLTSKTGAA